MTSEPVLQRPATRRVAIAMTAVVFFAGVVALTAYRNNIANLGDANLDVRGQAVVTSVNGASRTVTGTTTLTAGEVVEVANGSMVLTLPSGATLEGRSSTPYSTERGGTPLPATRVKIGNPPELQAGELLVVARNGATVTSVGNNITLQHGVDGPTAARVTRSLAVSAAVYRGALTLDSAGQKRDVPALHELEVSSLGRPPTEPKPIRLADDDPWDRRFLGAAIDLTTRLDPMKKTFAGSLAGETADVPFFQRVLPNLRDQSAFSADRLNSTGHPGPFNGDKGEALVGAAIASLGRQGSFGQRWDAVYAFRNAGAQWGLVALDQGVAADPLVSAVDTALRLITLPSALAAGAPLSTNPASVVAGPSGIAPAGTTTNAASGSTSPSRTSSPTQSGGGGGGGGGQTPTVTEPPAIPDTGVPTIDTVVKKVDDTLGGLLPKK